MAMAEKIKVLLARKQMTAVQLAKKLGTSPSNLYNKFKRDNFSEKELKEIAEVLDCTYEGFFFLDQDEKI